MIILSMIIKYFKNALLCVHQVRYMKIGNARQYFMKCSEASALSLYLVMFGRPQDAITTSVDQNKVAVSRHPLLLHDPEVMTFLV